MWDVYAILLLAAAFGLMLGFLNWCGRMVPEEEGERK